MSTVVSKSYKFRFYPSSAQRQQLAKDFGCARFAWNYALERRTKAYQESGERLTGVDLSRELTKLKNSTHLWLAEANSTVITQALRDQDRAFANFFAGRAKCPKFKKKRTAQSVRYQLDQRQVHRTFNAQSHSLALPNLGPLKLRWSREVGGVPKMVTVSRDACGRFFVAFSCEVEAQPLPDLSAPARAGGCPAQAGKTNLIGIDFGVKDVVVTSEGEKSGNPRHIKKRERHLKRAQRRLNRKTKGSHRYRKQQFRVARLHARVVDARRDFLHKTSWKLVSENQALAIQPHNVQGMFANHKLARAISDVGLGELTRQIKYKAQWYGRQVFEVDPWQRTTGVCPDCLRIGPKLALDVREWRCECGKVHDRDVASARVIKIVGAGGPEVMRVEGGTHRLAAAV
ncbi:MAG: transposase [Methylothermaceae bacterium]|nr:transposase [Methylothermaceae bacterium]